MEETAAAQEGIRSLMHTVLVGAVSKGGFDEESEELLDFLEEAAYLTKEDLEQIGELIENGTTRRNRARVRYLAALMPNHSLHELANAIHFVMDNRHISISDVRDVLRGQAREVPLEKIQTIGRLLTEGKSLRQTAREAGVSFDTVERIEGFIGIAESRRLHLVDVACDAVREGWSVRHYGRVANIPKSTAHVLMKKAQSVLVELGEIK